MAAAAGARGGGGADNQNNNKVGEMSKKELVSLITECLKPVQKTVNAMKKEVEDLHEKVANLTHEISKKDKEIVNLKERLEEQEQYSRRNNLRIFGVEETRNENTDELVVKVAAQIGVSIEQSQIDRSHRIGKRDSKKPRPIIVKFIGYAPRRTMFTAKKGLKGTGITIREDLTAQRLELLKRAVEAYYQENVWSNDGVIMVKAGTEKCRLKSFSDLDRLILKHSPPT